MWLIPRDHLKTYYTRIDEMSSKLWVTGNFNAIYQVWQAWRKYISYSDMHLVCSI